VLDLIVSNDGELPLFMRTGDGNESDKAVFGQIFIADIPQIATIYRGVFLYDSSHSGIVQINALSVEHIFVLKRY
jgi:hypothetical protein